MISITINGKNYLVERGNNILQICEFLNIEIPRFCYHKELSVAGNCRMCLVEIEKFPKPVASCAMPVADNMIIYTDSPLVRKARESVLEFVLINHPLDCPICDQGGECDLQDQTFKYGSDSSRFFLKNKRSVEDKNFGPLIKTVMTRCIHCTRCVRFADEIAGVYSLGTSGRGSTVEIGFYINQIFNSEFSGNIIDLCPVGALTAKPYAFKYRSWELTTINTIDLNDSLGVHIQIDVRNNEVIRIKPSPFLFINDSWITDKTRFSFDGLFNQQVLEPFISNNVTRNQFVIYMLIIFLFQKQFKDGMSFLVGENVGLSILNKFQNFAYSTGYSNVESTFIKNMNIDFEGNYKNSCLESFQDNDVILIISSNLRYELPNLNIKFKELKKKNVIIAYIGNYFNNTYDMLHLGISNETLIKIAKGKHFFSGILKKAKAPKILIGSSLKNDNLFYKNLELVRQITLNLQKKKVMLPLSLYPSSINKLDLGVISYNMKKKKLEKLYNFKNQLILEQHKKHLNNSINIYQEHNMTNIPKKSSIIIPMQNYLENKDYFVNIEGRLQSTSKILSLDNSKKRIKKDFEIINLLSNILNNKKVCLTNISIKKKLPYLNTLNYIFKSNFLINERKKTLSFKKFKFDFSIKNFYKTDMLSVLSKTMTTMSKKYHNKKNFI